MRWPQIFTAALSVLVVCCASCTDDSNPDTATNSSTSTSGGGTGGTIPTGGTGGAGGSGGTGGSTPTDGLAVSDDGHWLEFRGRSVLLAGDSITQGWMELGANFDQLAYLDALASRDIPVVMLWAFIGVVDQAGDPRIGYDAPEIWPWPQSGGTFDLGSFEDSYFQRLRTFVTAADERDIVVLLTIHDGWTKTRFDGHPFNAAHGGPLTDAAQYVELHDYDAEMPGTFDENWSRQQKHQFYLEQLCGRLIAETGDLTNVMYEMFNEGEWYDQTDLRAFQVHFLEFFDSRTTQPLVVNDDHVGGADFHDEPLADVISLHRPIWGVTTSAHDAFTHYAPLFGDTPIKPNFFSEPVPSFEGNSGELDAMMRLMWGTLVGGAGFVAQNDTSFGFDPNSAMAGQSTQRDAMLDLEGHAARFFAEAVPSLDGFEPNATACNTTMCLVRPAHTTIAYLQGGDSLTVNTNAFPGPMVARFYDPRTGTFEPEVTVSNHGPNVPFTAPSTGDWVFIITLQ